MRHLMLLSLLFAVPCFAATPMPDVSPPAQHSICQLKHCDCLAFDLAQVPELGPSSQACTCGHSPAVHGEQVHISSGSTHASGSSAFHIERDMSTINVTAKMRCNLKRSYEGQDGQTHTVKVELHPVYSADKTSENYSYSQSTPSGEVYLHITNPAAFDQFEQGGEYLVTFTRVEKRNDSPGAEKATG